MNNVRRAMIKKLIETLQAIDLETPKSDLEQIKDEESESFENMPDGLKQSDRGQASETAVSTLEDAFNELESAFDALANAVSGLEGIE